jgi:hypothetical protein
MRKKINLDSTRFLFREADIEDAPIAASMNIINIAHIYCSESLTSRTHPTAASMNNINVSGFEKNK